MTPHPTSSYAKAVELAEARQDYYVKWGYHVEGVKTEGPFSEADKDELVNRLFLTEVDVLVVFKAVEVYKG